MITLNHNDLTEDLAYLVENEVILEAINRTLISPPNHINVRYGCKIKEYILPTQRTSGKSESAWAQVHFNDGEVIEARLLVSTLCQCIYSLLILIFCFEGTYD